LISESLSPNVRLTNLSPGQSALEEVAFARRKLSLDPKGAKSGAKNEDTKRLIKEKLSLWL